VLTNQFLGPENRRAGQTLWAWMTGAAGWYYRAMTEWMLGVRADYDGLLIDPCLPSSWTHCALERDFRGARYRVTISNPNGLQKGTPLVNVDGKPLDGATVPVFDDGKTHSVDVTLE
jgi:cellobiose phosphorylase